jgi:hypothetical protein
MAGKKIAYRTATLERALPVDRVEAWAAVTEITAGRSAEVILSDESPWRRVARLDGDHPSPLCQTSITIRDDGDRCLVAWSCLVDPTDVGAEALDDMVAHLTDDGARLLEQLAGSVAAPTA